MTWRTAAIAAAVLAVALLVGGLAAHGQSPPGAAAQSTADQAFLSALHQQGIPVADEQQATTRGREVCANFDRFPAVGVALTNMVNETGLPEDQAGRMVGSAVAVYCPAHVAEVKRQAADMVNQAVVDSGP